MGDINESCFHGRHLLMSPRASLLHLEALPLRTTPGTIIRLLEQVGGLERRWVGAIELRGRTATVEVPPQQAARLVKLLDGANLANQHLRAWVECAGEGGGPADHFQRLLRLLDIEGRAESEQLLAHLRELSGADAEASGNSLVALVVREEHPGLGGRCLVTLTRRDASRPLPWTRLGVGAPVLLSEERVPSSGWRGVVSDRNTHAIQIAVPEPPATSHQPAVFRVDLSSDEVARQRQRAALERARIAHGDRLAELRRILLGERLPAFRPELPLRPLDESLNPSQLRAVQFALSATDVAIVHGPPGTGKTTAIVELIRQSVLRGEKVLACAPSNLAVDNLLERLLAAGENALRVGHPARVLPALRAHTLDLLVEEHPDVKLAQRFSRQAQTLRERATRFTRAKPAPGSKREMYEEAKRLVQDARRLETQVIQHVLDSASVVCMTNTALDSELLGQRFFDLAVIDEACQATEPGCWIPLARCARLVLAGDHCQLPPTVISVEAQQQGLAVSLFERLMALQGPLIARRLEIQYRMHEQIMQFSSQEFYESALRADDTVRSHRLCDLAGVTDHEGTRTPLQFIDTSGAGYDETREPDGESRLNLQEAGLVRDQVQALLDSGVAPGDVAVIAPYSAQVRLLREHLEATGVEIDTVDGFQGREKEAVIISLVRANPRGEIGFLADTRRMNVALTRARRKLIVIGDGATVGAHPFYQRLISHFEQHSAYRSVWEL